MRKRGREALLLFGEDLPLSGMNLWLMATFPDEARTGRAYSEGCGTCGECRQSRLRLWSLVVGPAQLRPGEQ